MAAAATSDVAADAANVDPEITPIEVPDFAEWLPDSLLPLWEAIAAYPLLGSVVIAAIFFVAAHVLRLLVSSSLGRLAGLTTSLADDLILENLKRPVFTTIFFTGLTLAVKTAQLPFGTDLLVKIIVSVIVVSWMRAALRISVSVLDVLSNQTRFAFIEVRTVPLIDLTVKLLIILVGSYALLMVWGINPIGWLASAGIVGIAVGFAAKDSLANLFSGFFIVADAPYKIGDYINLDTGERGRVTAIGLRSTRLLTRADVEITVPNGVIANAKIVNESGGPSKKMRIRVVTAAAYGSDVDQICELLQEIGEKHPDVCTDPAPRVRMRAFGASSLDFDLMVWIEQPQDRGRITHELLMQVYKIYAEKGIEIPYSKHDVYIKEMPGDMPDLAK